MIAGNVFIFVPPVVFSGAVDLVDCEEVGNFRLFSIPGSSKGEFACAFSPKKNLQKADMDIHIYKIQVGPLTIDIICPLRIWILPENPDFQLSLRWKGWKSFKKTAARKNTPKEPTKNGLSISTPWKVVHFANMWIQKGSKKMDPKFSRKHQVFPSSPEQFVENTPLFGYVDSKYLFFKLKNSELSQFTPWNSGQLKPIHSIFWDPDPGVGRNGVPGFRLASDRRKSDALPVQTPRAARWMRILGSYTWVGSSHDDL